MKKILLSLAVVSLISFTACKDDKKATEGQDAAAPVEQTEGQDAAASTSGDASAQVPNFSDPEVQKFVNEYDAFVKEYMDAVKSQDMSKVASLGQKAQEWATKQTEISTKLASNPDDLKKFSDYVQKLSQEMTQSLTGQ